MVVSLVLVSFIVLSKNATTFPIITSLVSIDNNCSGKVDEGCPMLFEDSIEVYMSSDPHNLVCLYQQLGPHKANLHIKGISQTNPSFTIEADIIYDYGPRFELGEDYPSKNGEWIIRNIQHSIIPQGYIAPIIEEYDWPSQTSESSECVQVFSGGSNEYRMTWEISGEATPGVSANPLMGTRQIPWVGNKKILGIRARHTDPLISSGQDEYDYNLLESQLNLLSTAFSRMSNGLVNIDYEIKEAYYNPPYDPMTTYCGGSTQCAVDLVKGLLLNLSINETNFEQDEYDHTVVTFYQSMIDAYNNGINLGSYSGQWPNKRTCSQCEWINYMTRIEGSIARFMHEFSHGFGFGHDEVRYNVLDAIQGEVKEEHLWWPGINPERYNTVSLMGKASMRLSPLMRTVLGWVKGNQVRLITKSGTYDLYGDNDNMTYDINNPLILQIALKRSDGSPSFVFITIPNVDHMSPFEELQAYSKYNGFDVKAMGYGDYYDNGIQLWTVSGISQMSGDISFNAYSYNINSTNAQQAGFGSPILSGQEVHLNWGINNITIRNVERNGNYARVEVIYNNDNNDCGFCDECDSPWWPFDCDFEECHSCGDCYYRGEILGQSDCIDLNESCISHGGTLVEECSDYFEEECDNDPCNLNCKLNGNQCVDECIDEDNDGWNLTAECNSNNAIDCNDDNPNIHPGAAETCGDGVDFDCDSYDSNGYNLNSSCGAGSCTGALVCSGLYATECSSNGDDCGVCCACDLSGFETYDNTQNSDCKPEVCPESGCGIGGCGENILAIYPDNIPNSCSGLGSCTNNSCTPICEIDADNDSYSPFCGDCYDNNSNVHPPYLDEQSKNLCNGIDDDCDKEIDENCPCSFGQTRVCGTGNCTSTQTCNINGYWGNCSSYGQDCGVCCICDSAGSEKYDATQDSDCNPSECPDSNCESWSCGKNIFAEYPESIPNTCLTLKSCRNKICIPTCESDTDKDNFSLNCGDCDDNNVDINPWIIEKCNNIDDNCNSKVDEGLLRNCSLSKYGICAENNETELCLNGKWSGCPLPQEEICGNEIDEDCNGITEECLTCRKQGGFVCGKEEYCPGDTINASNTDRCCNKECLMPVYANCSDCGSGLFDICDRKECYGTTEKCYYIDTLKLGGTCLSCRNLSCKNYNDEQSCLDDNCGIRNCDWSDNDGCMSYNPDDRDEDHVPDDLDCNDYNKSIGICKGCSVCSINPEGLGRGACISGMCKELKCPPKGICGAKGISLNCNPNEIGIYPEFVDRTCRLINDNVGVCSPKICTPECRQESGCSEDYDMDGIPDAQDSCKTNNTKINMYGCPMPVMDKFKGEIITNLTYKDLNNLTNFTIGKRNTAKIEFKGRELKLVRNVSGMIEPLNFDEFIIISHERVEIKSNLSELNQSAVITMYNVTLTSPYIIRDGQRCDACDILSYENNTLVFSVPHFTTYTLGHTVYELTEGPYCGNGLCDGDEQCNSCISDCGVCPSDSDSGGGGGGGGGGGSASISESQHFGNIPTGGTLSKEYSKSEQIAVTTIKVNVRNSVNNVRIEVKKANKPLDSPEPVIEGGTYKYISIISTNIKDDDINKANINFKIEKKWLDNNSYDKNKVALNRYKSKKWVKILTKKKTENIDYVFYEAETPGFSIFAITAGKITEIKSVKTISETPDEEVNVTEVSKKVEKEIEEKSEEKARDITAESKRRYGWLIVLIIGLLVITMVIVLLYLQRKNKPPYTKKTTY